MYRHFPTCVRQFGRARLRYVCPLARRKRTRLNWRADTLQLRDYDSWFKSVKPQRRCLECRTSNDYKVYHHTIFFWFDAVYNGLPGRNESTLEWQKSEQNGRCTNDE